MSTRHRIASIALIALSLVLAACGLSAAPHVNTPEPSPPTVVPPQTEPAQTEQPQTEQPADDEPATETPDPALGLSADERLAAAADAAVQALKNRDLQQLATVVHPDGVRISPYGHVVVDGDYPHLVFTPEDLTAPDALDVTHTWGVYDGSGEPIVLTLREFIDEFLYDKDYAAAPEIAWNEIIGTGNTLVNHADVYPDSVFVEYHVPGSAQFDGMDWGSLRLVFSQHGDDWLLVGIIHDQWTI